MPNAIRKYKKTHYDIVELMLPKGKKEILKQMAKESGASSLSSWVAGIIEKETGVELVLRGELPTLKK